MNAMESGQQTIVYTKGKEGGVLCPPARPPAPRGK